jgi:hypothetical protein
MAGEEDAAAASPAAVRKPPKEEEEDDDELDNVPLAISRAKKSGNASASKVKEEDDEEDNMPISRSRGKKVCLHLPRSLFSGLWRGGRHGASDARS